MQNFCVIGKISENAERTGDSVCTASERLAYGGVGDAAGFGRHRLHAYGDWTHGQTEGSAGFAGERNFLRGVR